MSVGNLLFWAIIVASGLAAAAFLAMPLLRRSSMAGDQDAELAFHRAQLDELGRDLERGLITQEQFAVAEAEIGRRLLGDPNRRKKGSLKPGKRSVAMAALVGLSVPAAAVFLYLSVGSPGVPSQPFGDRTDQAGREYQALIELSRTLEQRLADRPDDSDTIVALAEARGRLRQFSQSADLYRRAIALLDDDPGLRGVLLAAYAEMSILAADGEVTGPAREAIAESLRLNPDEPRARYYFGVVRLEAGDVQGALRVWRGLRADSSPDAPWMASLQARIAEAEMQVANEGTAPALDPEAMASMMELSEDERADRISQMVEGLAARLEADPDDLDGWLRLARAYGVMGRHNEAIEALNTAAGQAEESDAGQLDAVLRAYLMQAEAAAEPPSGEAALVASKLYAINPAHPAALWVLADAARLAGESAASRGFYRLLLNQLPEGTPEYAEVQRQIELLAE